MNRLISEEPGDICTLRYPDGVKIVSYADDIVIMSNEPERNALIQQALTTLDQRCRVLGLQISVDKTKFVRYTPGQFNNEEPQFTLQGTDIERVPSYKYLGVTFDEKLNWKEHGEKTAANINKKKQHFEISSRQRMGHQHTIIAKICQWLLAAHS